MFYDYKLKFVDKAEADAILEQFAHDILNVTIHEIGIIQKQINISAEDENAEIVDFEELEGWHIDVRMTYKTDILNDYMLTVDNPVHNFFDVNEA